MIMSLPSLLKPAASNLLDWRCQVMRWQYPRAAKRTSFTPHNHILQFCPVIYLKIVKHYATKASKYLPAMRRSKMLLSRGDASCPGNWHLHKLWYPLLTLRAYTILSVDILHFEVWTFDNPKEISVRTYCTLRYHLRLHFSQPNPCECWPLLCFATELRFPARRLRHLFSDDCFYKILHCVKI